MRNRNIIINIVLLPLLYGCASVSTYNNCDVFQNNQTISLHPAAYQVAISNTQQIEIETAEQKFGFISALEVSDKKLSMVGLNMMGQKLFQLQYQTGNLHFEGYGMPGSFAPEFLLTDLSIMYGSEQALRGCYEQAGIPFNYIMPSRRVRNITLQREQGRESISIQYSHENVWHSFITFTNDTRAYTIKVSPLTIQDL